MVGLTLVFGSIAPQTPTPILPLSPIRLLEEFDPRDMRRRILVGHYEMRYEVVDSAIYLLCLWPTYKDRQDEDRTCWSTS